MRKDLRSLKESPSSKHRGPHPKDHALFGPGALPALREAVADLSWLLGRGYAEPSALKLVGDRHRLVSRQRTAVLRSSCTDAQRARRGERRATPASLSGQAVAVDGFNCVIVLETALSGGVVLRGRDGALRDLSSVHGTYRRVNETPATLLWLGRALAMNDAAPVTWYFDRPVSNSGVLKATLEALARREGWSHRVELDDRPDERLAASVVAASADAWVLDRAAAWLDLPALAMEIAGHSAWIVDLATDR
jgi:hypothetical protein